MFYILLMIYTIQHVYIYIYLYIYICIHICMYMYLCVCGHISNPSRLPQPRSAFRIPHPSLPRCLRSHGFPRTSARSPCCWDHARLAAAGAMELKDGHHAASLWVIYDILCVSMRTGISVSIILIENQRRESARNRERERGRWAFCDQCRCHMVPNPRHEFLYITEKVHFSCSNM